MVFSPISFIGPLAGTMFYTKLQEQSEGGPLLERNISLPAWFSGIRTPLAIDNGDGKEGHWSSYPVEAPIDLVSGSERDWRKAGTGYRGCSGFSRACKEGACRPPVQVHDRNVIGEMLTHRKGHDDEEVGQAKLIRRSRLWLRL
jgi:hypothetical protein